MNLEDTIVAISSPPGSAARGIVRLTGPQCLDIASHIFHSSNASSLSTLSAPTCIKGEIAIPSGYMTSQVYLFRRPHSYTRDDLVEFHLLGCPSLLAEVVEACLQTGARRAEPGEFTARAYLAGSFDLSQVHGVAGLIAAHSDEQLRAAERLLHGTLGTTSQAAREELADLLSLVEGALDFADEPIEFITPTALKDRLAIVSTSLRETWTAGLRAERWTDLPRVVLAGPPNVGKSSLLNRLTGMDRAICAPISGTTRDALSAPLSLGETACLLIDVAGVDDATTELDAKAQAVAKHTIEDADLLLQMFDAGDISTNSVALIINDSVAPVINRCKNSIHIVNKSDLLNATTRREFEAKFLQVDGSNLLFVSAATGEGCEELKRAIAATLHGRTSTTGDSAIALMAEHREALQSAVEAIERATELAAGCDEFLDNADLVAAELHVAADALATLAGKDLTEETLGRIFSRFCVGK